METIKNYIFEKLRIGKDFKIPEPPLEVDINKFGMWLKQDFKFTDGCINDLKKHIKEEWHLDEDEYTFMPHEDAHCDEQEIKFINNFPNSLGDKSLQTKLYFQIGTKGCDYIISGCKYISKVTHMHDHIIFIQSKNTQKALYAYIINIMLG